MTDVARSKIMALLRNALGEKELQWEPGEARMDFLVQPDWARYRAAIEKRHAEFMLAADPDEAREALISRAVRGAVKKAVLSTQPLVLELGLAQALAGEGIEVLTPGKDAVNGAAGAQMGATCALAGLLDTGSVVVDSGPDRPLSYSLLPPLHVALLPGSRMLASHMRLPGLIRSLGAAPTAVHIITGSSSTADIELVKVYGVHGPVELLILGRDWL